MARRIVACMNSYPAQEELEARRRREAVELCGKNRGPHTLIPIEWLKVETVERVTRLMCVVCFCNLSVKNLLDNYRGATL